MPLAVSDVPVALPKAAAHHLGTVLRARQGSAVTLFNGEGGEYPAVLTEVQRRAVMCRVTGYEAPERRSPLPLHLVQALAKGTRMDLVVQKATELGVTSVQPLAAERSNVRLDTERASDRLEHWQRIAIAACEQCGRNELPELRPLVGVAELAAVLPGEIGRVADPDASERLRDLAPSLDGAEGEPSAAPLPGLTLVVGPEGGLTPAEIAMLANKGYVGIRLGPRILRTETAGLAALAALQALFGDL